MHTLDSSAGSHGSDIELCVIYSREEVIMKLELLERIHQLLDLIRLASLASVESSIDGRPSALILDFRSKAVLAKAIVKSEFLRLVVVELEVAGTICCSLCT